jgi:hypothetical protein
MRFMPVQNKFVAEVEDIYLTAPSTPRARQRSTPAWTVMPCWCSVNSR